MKDGKSRGGGMTEERIRLLEEANFEWKPGRGRKKGYKNIKATIEATV